MGPVRVIGVEPETGDDVKQSLEQGRVVELPDTPRTIADGQQTRAPGVHTFPVIRERVNEIVTVTDEEIVAAMRLAFQRLNVVVEPSGASALAAVLSGAIDVTGQRVGITLSGGNVDLNRFLALTA
jgi:threonine dehydratase